MSTFLNHLKVHIPTLTSTILGLAAWAEHLEFALKALAAIGAIVVAFLGAWHHLEQIRDIRNKRLAKK